MSLFAEYTKRVDGAAVSEILAMMADPEIISFCGGSPAKEAFPVETIRDFAVKALNENPLTVLQYGVTEGWKPLRQAYLEHMVLPKGVKADIGNVATLTGATQGIIAVSEVFLNPGDTVLVESPTFLSTLSVFSKLSAQAVPVEVDDDGMIMDDLEEKIKRHKPKILYCIPTFQNPTGRTLKADRRQKIAELASRYDVIVLEDDPYCELRYRGQVQPPIKSFDESGHVIMLNSFSKIISPGLRVGAMVAAPEIIKKVVIAKQLLDTHTANLNQAICADFLNAGLLPGHLKKIVPIYAQRLDCMLRGIKAHFPKDCEYTTPEGGLFVWVKLPGNPDLKALLKKATTELKVAFIPGGPFFINPQDGHNCIRLNFSSVSPENIDIGMQRMGRLFCDALSR